MFSERSWCKHDSNDATENNDKYISFVQHITLILMISNVFKDSYCQSVVLVPSKIASPVPIDVQEVAQDFAVYSHGQLVGQYRPALSLMMALVVDSLHCYVPAISKHTYTKR